MESYVLPTWKVLVMLLSMLEREVMMTQQKNRNGSDDARDALDAVQEAGRAGLARALPPRWFGAVIAAITGALVASAGMGKSPVSGPQLPVR